MRNQINFRNLLLIGVILASLILILASGTINTPFDKQQRVDKIPLTDDPDSNSGFSLPDFNIPEFDFPVLSSVLGLTGSGLFIIALLVLIMVLLFITSIIVTRVIKNKKEEDQVSEDHADADIKELIKRRITLGNRIESISTFLKISLEEGNYNKGITQGFEKLDTAMKEFSKISRPGWLTPREYANMRIPYFNHQSLSSAVEIFYKSTYSKLNATQKDLEEFINYFQAMIVDFSILKWKADTIIYPEGDSEDV